MEQVAEPLRSEQLANLTMAEPHSAVYRVVKYSSLQKGLNIAWAPAGKDRFRIDASTLLYAIGHPDARLTS